MRFLLWDGLNCLEERLESGDLVARYCYGYSKIYGIGSCVEIYLAAQNDTYTLVMDHRGTATVLLNSAGTPVAFRQYNAFVEILCQVGTWLVDYGFQTNWMSMKIGRKWWGLSAARVYDFAIGRFTQRDQLGMRDGPNLYIYCQSDPVNLVDPFGLRGVKEQDIKDPKGKLCGTIRVYEPSEDGKRGIEFKFDTSKADKGAQCCDPCKAEKATYGIIQHVQTPGSPWHYDNAAANYSTTDNQRATGSESNPDLPNQPTQRPKDVDPPGAIPESMYNPGPKFGFNPAYPGKRWLQNPWYAGDGNPSNNIGNPSPSTDISDVPGGNENFRTQVVCVEGGKVLWDYSWNGPKPVPKKNP